MKVHESIVIVFLTAILALEGWQLNRVEEIGKSVVKVQQQLDDHIKVTMQFMSQNR